LIVFFCIPYRNGQNVDTWYGTGTKFCVLLEASTHSNFSGSRIALSSGSIFLIYPVRFYSVKYTELRNKRYAGLRHTKLINQIINNTLIKLSTINVRHSSDPF